MCKSLSFDVLGNSIIKDIYAKIDDVCSKLDATDAAICMEVNEYCVEVQRLPSETDEQTVTGPIVESLWMDTDDRWPLGKKITVAFLEDCDHPNLKVKEIIKGIAHSWTEEANIGFHFIEDNNDQTNPDEADVRIQFLKTMTYSLVGRKFKAKGQATMNFAISHTHTEEEIKRKVLHEFGHVLGFRHEHSSPKSPLKFNRDEVITHYERRLSQVKDRRNVKQWVEKNIFRKENTETTMASDFDSLSIMMYEIYPAWTDSKKLIPLPMDLSETDKKMVQELYPFNLTPPIKTVTTPRTFHAHGGSSAAGATAKCARRTKSAEIPSNGSKKPGEGRRQGGDGRTICDYEDCIKSDRQCDSCFRYQKKESHRDRRNARGKDNRNLAKIYD